MSLRDEIDFAVTAVLLEIRTGFDMPKFKSMEGNYRRQHRYAESKLEKLGEGSSREVYLLSNRHVLKMAIPKERTAARGVAQNEAEVEAYTNPKMKPVLSKIYDADSRYLWIVSELVRPLDYREFFETIGIRNEEILQEVIKRYIDADYNVEDARQYFQSKINELQERIDNEKRMLRNPKIIDFKKNWLERGIKSMTKKIGLIQEHIDAYDNSFVKLILELEDEFEILLADTKRFNHWGKTADGRIVLLDYGFTESVSFLHY